MDLARLTNSFRPLLDLLYRNEFSNKLNVHFDNICACVNSSSDPKTCSIQDTFDTIHSFLSDVLEPLCKQAQRHLCSHDEAPKRVFLVYEKLFTELEFILCRSPILSISSQESLYEHHPNIKYVIVYFTLFSGMDGNARYLEFAFDMFERFMNDSSCHIKASRFRFSSSAMQSFPCSPPIVLLASLILMGSRWDKLLNWFMLYSCSSDTWFDTLLNIHSSMNELWQCLPQSSEEKVRMKGQLYEYIRMIVSYCQTCSLSLHGREDMQCQYGGNRKRKLLISLKFLSDFIPDDVSLDEIHKEFFLTFCPQIFSKNEKLIFRLKTEKSIFELWNLLRFRSSQKFLMELGIDFSGLVSEGFISQQLSTTKSLTKLTLVTIILLVWFLYSEYSGFQSQKLIKAVLLFIQKIKDKIVFNNSDEESILKWSFNRTTELIFAESTRRMDNIVSGLVKSLIHEEGNSAKRCKVRD